MCDSSVNWEFHKVVRSIRARVIIFIRFFSVYGSLFWFSCRLEAYLSISCLFLHWIIFTQVAFVFQSHVATRILHDPSMVQRCNFVRFIDKSEPVKHFICLLLVPEIYEKCGWLLQSRSIPFDSCAHSLHLRLPCIDNVNEFWFQRSASNKETINIGLSSYQNTMSLKTVAAYSINPT